MSLDSSGFVDLLLSRRRRISQLMEGYVRCPEYDIVTSTLTPLCMPLHWAVHKNNYVSGEAAG